MDCALEPAEKPPTMDAICQGLFSRYRAIRKVRVEPAAVADPLRKRNLDSLSRETDRGSSRGHPPRPGPISQQTKPENDPADDRGICAKRRERLK